MFSQAAETRAQKLVAIQFFILAPCLAFESIHALIANERADVSWLGIALSASNLLVMPYLRQGRGASCGGQYGML